MNSSIDKEKNESKSETNKASSSNGINENILNQKHNKTFEKKNLSG
jgi:hypothetical protein